MKTGFYVILLSAVTTLLSAAEPVGYTWLVHGIEGKNKFGKTPVTPEQPVAFSPDQNSRWGAGAAVTFDKTEINALYRLRIDCKSNGPAGFHYRPKNSSKWVGFVPVNKGTATLFVRPASEKENGVQFSFGKKGAPLEIRSITVEKIKPEEYTRNLLVEDGLEPGFWHTVWGKKDNRAGQLKKDPKSPFGKVLLLPASLPEEGHKATLLLPFIPGRKFEISFWLRSAEPAAVMCQVVGVGMGHTRIGLKTEWSEYKFTGKTPENAPKNGMWLMFYIFKAGTPAFEVGGVDFHYLP